MNGSDLQWEPTPSYGELANVMLEFVQFAIREPMGLSAGSYLTLYQENGIGVRGITLLLALALGWTLARQIITKRVLQPLGRHYELTPSGQRKMPECAWRFFFYFTAWSWAFYLTVVKYRYFQRPSTTFINWEPHSEVPWDMNLLYALEFSFYLHSLYTVIFMDLWKKDSKLLIFHHVETLILLSFSYVGRYTPGGSLVVLCHDCCDIFLELAKLSNYFRRQGGKFIRLFDNIGMVAFGFLAVTWLVSRLYFFPLRVIYTTVYTIRFGFLHRMHLMYLNFTMGLFLLAMDIYWFVLIVDLILRLSSGRMAELDDTRDYDVQIDTKVANGKTGVNKSTKAN